MTTSGSGRRSAHRDRPSLRRNASGVAPGAPASATRTLRRGLEEAPMLREGLLLTFVMAALGAGGRVVVPILIQQSIDRGVVGDGEVRVGLVAGFVALAAGALALAAWGQRQAVVRLGTRSEEALYALRARLIGHVHRLSLADHNEERRGGLVARVTSDIETLTQFFQRGGLALLLNGMMIVVVAIVMIVYDWILASIAFVVAAPLVVVLRVVQRHLVVAYDRARYRNAEMLTSATELVTGAETLHAYDAGQLAGTAAREAVAQRRRANIRANLIGAFLFPSGELFAVLTVSAVVGVGVARGAGGGLTAGAMVGFVFLTYRFLEPVAEFTEILDQTQTAVAGLRRVIGVLDMPVGPPAPSDPRGLPDGPLSIDLERVMFRYPTRHPDGAAHDGMPGGDGDGDRAGAGEVPAPALRELDLHLEAASNVALVGATGSGKTTLGRLIARFADPTEGSIRLGGVPLTHVDNEQLRQRLVVVAQEPFLFDDTIAANVAFGRPGSSVADVEEIIDRLDLRTWVASLGDGVETRVGERGDQLSAGERQLVALMRAGIANPSVLVLDEATSSVDALTEVRISHALERLARGRTTISIAHRLSTAARADRVVVLEHGRPVGDGPHDILLATNPTYQSLYHAWLTATTT